jgi:hypothetical protein
MGKKRGRKMKVKSAPAPRPTMQVDKPRYNPTWNPQWLKVMREFQYSTTTVDRAGGYAVITDPTVTCSSTAHAYGSGALTFAIDQVPNVSEFGALFDQYRIAAVQLTFDYISATQATAPITSSPSQRFTLLVYEDYDDSTAPAATNAGFSTVYESGRAKRMVFPSRSNRLTYTVRPKYLVTAADYALVGTPSQLGSGWLDGATNAVLWRGVKWIAQANPAPTTNVATWRVYAKYFLEWRNRQ